MCLQEYQEDFEFIHKFEEEGFRVFKWTKADATDGTVLLLNDKWGVAEEKSREVHQRLIEVAGHIKRWKPSTLGSGNKKIVCVRTSLEVSGTNFPVFVTCAHGDSSFEDTEQIIDCTHDVCKDASYFLR